MIKVELKSIENYVLFQERRIAELEQQVEGLKLQKRFLAEIIKESKK